LRNEPVVGVFVSRPAHQEHRANWWSDPGIDELRAWLDQNPPHSVVTARVDPMSPQSLTPDPTPEIFNWYSVRPQLLVAAISGVLGGLLLAIAFVLRSRRTD